MLRIVIDNIENGESFIMLFTKAILGALVNRVMTDKALT